jgi:hypothetical protein
LWLLANNTPLFLPPVPTYKRTMLKIDQINEIHRLASGEHWSMRRIARHLHLAARTVKKYLQAPVPLPANLIAMLLYLKGDKGCGRVSAR